MKELDKAYLLWDISEARTKITNIRSSLKKYCESNDCEDALMPQEECDMVLNLLTTLDDGLKRIGVVLSREELDSDYLLNISKAELAQMLSSQTFNSIGKRVKAVTEMERRHKVAFLESFKFKDGTELVDCIPLFEAMNNGIVYQNGKIPMGVSGILMYNGTPLLKVHDDWYETYTYTMKGYTEGKWTLEEKE